MTNTTKCPCQSGKVFSDCCQPYLSKAQPAPTAEALMRSRYTAYVQGDIDYIESTTAVEARRDFDRQGSEAWAKQAEWLGLEVISTEAGGTDDRIGKVEFAARYRMDGIENRHHELSDFRREDRQWFFVDGKLMREPTVNTGPQVGRNDPCPCGSGKKYKKCCA